ncbi:MAG: hydrogenase maturation protease [Thermoprotei archaeon]
MYKYTAIFLGNSILGDDRIGLIAGEMLKERLVSHGIDVHIVERSGLALLDYLSGYEKAVIVDSVKTNKYPIGSVIVFSPEEFKRAKPMAPHFLGVVDAIDFIRNLKLNEPKKVIIIGIEVKDPYIISEELSRDLKEHLDKIIEEIYHKILEFILS